MGGEFAIEVEGKGSVSKALWGGVRLVSDAVSWDDWSTGGCLGYDLAINRPWCCFLASWHFRLVVVFGMAIK